MTESKLVIAWQLGMRGALTEMTHKGAFWDDGNVLCPYCDGGYKGMHIFQNFLNVHLKWVQYITCLA